MKIFSLGIVLLFASFAKAGSITLTWDWPATYMNDTYIAANPSILSFRMYSKITTAAYNYANPSWTGPIPPAKVIGLLSGSSYCFVVRSYKSNNNMESPDSNEVCGRVPRLNPPSGFQLINFDAELNMETGIIHYLGYYSNAVSGESMTMETTQKFSEL